MFSHLSDAIKDPYIIEVSKNLYVARFESMKIYSTLEAIKKLLDKGTINKDSQLILINIGQHKDTSDFYKMLEYKKGDKFVEIEYNFNECEVT